MSSTPPAGADYPFYGMDGELISFEDAQELMLDFRKRVLKSIKLDFMGNLVVVITTFIPIDQGSTWGTYTANPMCWVSEVIGGPPDLNGVYEYSASRSDALDTHELVVDRALASGCTVR